MSRLDRVECSTTAPLPFLRLVARSPDVGEGWVQCSDGLWNHFKDLFEKFPTLVDHHDATKRVRLTSDAKVLLRWL